MDEQEWPNRIDKPTRLSECGINQLQNWLLGDPFLLPVGFDVEFDPTNTAQVVNFTSNKLALDHASYRREEVSYALGWLFYAQERYGEAITQLEHTLDEVHDESILAYFCHLIGVCYGQHWRIESEASQKDFVSCVFCLEKGIAAAKKAGKNNHLVAITCDLAIIQSEVAEHRSDAVELLKDALELSGISASMLRLSHANLGCIYDNYEEFERAIFHFEQAISYDTENPNEHSWIYRRLAMSQMLFGDSEAAFDNVKKALNLADPSTSFGEARKADAQRTLGIMSFDVGEYDSATKVLRSYLKLRPDDVDAEVRFGLSLLGQGQYREGKKLLNRILKSGKDFEYRGSVLAQIGVAAYKKRRSKDAVHYLNQALEFEDGDEEMTGRNFWLGHAFFKLERYEEAAAAYRHALQLIDSKSPQKSDLMLHLIAVEREFR